MSGDAKGDVEAPAQTDAAKPGAAEVVKEDGHTEEVDFKSLTAEETFQVLGVRSYTTPVYNTRRCTSVYAGRFGLGSAMATKNAGANLLSLCRSPRKALLQLRLNRGCRSTDPTNFLRVHGMLYWFTSGESATPVV